MHKYKIYHLPNDEVNHGIDRQDLPHLRLLDLQRPEGGAQRPAGEGISPAQGTLFAARLPLPGR